MGVGEVAKRAFDRAAHGDAARGDEGTSGPAVSDPRVTTAPELPFGCALPWRRLPAARRTTGRERRWLDPQRGVFKRFERTLDRFAARHVYPHLLGVWHPYCWLLPRRFALSVATLAPPRWPRHLGDLRVLHLSDVHCGAFLHPEVLAAVLEPLMAVRPDLVAITGDIVEGQIEDLDGFLSVLAPLARAPLGAWYCHGNHDYFTAAPEVIRDQLEAVGIRTLRNRSVVVRTARGGDLVLGGIDDRVLGRPDWSALVADHGPPALLLAHHPDDFYEAERRGIALVLSGHTHGGQIRLPGTSWPIVRQSRFRLDEGAYRHGAAMLIVSRGLGAVGLPWRSGADPEAGLLRVRGAP